MAVDDAMNTPPPTMSAIERAVNTIDDADSRKQLAALKECLNAVRSYCGGAVTGREWMCVVENADRAATEAGL